MKHIVHNYWTYRQSRHSRRRQLTPMNSAVLSQMMTTASTPMPRLLDFDGHWTHHSAASIWTEQDYWGDIG